MVQVKHYIDSPYPTLRSSLKKELPKVKQKQPQHYYVCCGKKLTAQNISEIYQLFSDYMDDAEAVVDLMEIDRFLHKKENADILERHYKLWLESTSVLERLGNQDIAIDCDAFFYQIKKEQKLFVKTPARVPPSRPARRAARRARPGRVARVRAAPRRKE